MTVEETEWSYGPDPLSEAGKFYHADPSQRQDHCLGKSVEVLFLNIVSWSQVSSISFSGTKECPYIFFLKKLCIVSPPPFFSNFIYLIILAMQYGTWALSSLWNQTCVPLHDSHPLQWKPGVLTTGLQGSPLPFYFHIMTRLLNHWIKFLFY